jgi:hypothetical protein
MNLLLVSKLLCYLPSTSSEDLRAFFLCENKVVVPLLENVSEKKNCSMSLKMSRIPYASVSAFCQYNVDFR